MIEATKRCPECGHENLFINKEKGEVICRECSFVVEDAMMDFGKDRVLDSEDLAKKSRSGAPFDPRVANNLVTELGSKEDLSKLPAKTRFMIQRLRKKNRWGCALEQNLTKALGNLDLITSQLNLPKRVEKEIARIYRTCAERGITRMRSIDNVTAACVYIASKMQGVPKTLNEVSEVTKIDKYVIAKTAKIIQRKLEIKNHVTNPVDLVERFTSELGLDVKVQFQAVKLLEKIQKLGITSGKSPLSLAATCIYISALMNKTKITQQKIAHVSGITETTLRNRCKEIMKVIGLKKKDLKKK